jgi:hypothetical protein
MRIDSTKTINTYNDVAGPSFIPLVWWKHVVGETAGDGAGSRSLLTGDRGLGCTYIQHVASANRHIGTMFN